MNPTYFDYAATTPVDPRVVQAMQASLGSVYGNASAVQHAAGREAAKAISQARDQLATLVKADPAAITWTSGATESNNLAILGAAEFYGDRGRHLICSATEHSSVLTPMQQLQRRGYRLTLLQPDSDGIITPEQLAAALQPDTVLVSIQHANNETGVCQDIAALGNCLEESQALFHVDAAQSLGKVTIDMSRLNCDLVSFSAHKIYGPKGVGALYVHRKPRVNLTPMLFGGGQQASLRPGTLPTHQIVGFGEACEIADQQLPQEWDQLWALHRRLIGSLISDHSHPGYRLNGHASQRLPGIINLSAIDSSRDLLAELPKQCLANGSACNSAQPGPSHVLLAMGLSRQASANALRISFGRFTSASEIDTLSTDLLGLIGH
ncbi:MAG: cysteine desulfurase family protein [Gammaproteobacteria bacterium]